MANRGLFLTEAIVEKNEKKIDESIGELVTWEGLLPEIWLIAHRVMNLAAE